MALDELVVVDASLFVPEANCSKKNNFRGAAVRLVSGCFCSGVFVGVPTLRFFPLEMVVSWIRRGEVSVAGMSWTSSELLALDVVHRLSRFGLLL